MARSALKFSALASFICLIVTVGLWALSFAANPRKQYVSLAPSFHLSVWTGRLVVFNDAEYGPYRGSIIGLTDESGNSVPRVITRKWGDAYGVYYRHFYWPDTGGTLWTVMVSLAYPLAIFSTLPVVWMWSNTIAGPVASPASITILRDSRHEEQ